MVREVRFITRYYASLSSGSSAFIFVAHTVAEAENLRAKARLWYNVLRGVFCPSMADSSQLLVVYSGLRHIGWVTAEEVAEGLASLLATL